MYRNLQKKYFTRFANVRKCSFLWAYAFNICKNANMKEKKFGKFHFGVSKTQNFMQIPNFVKWTQINVPEKVILKKHCQKVKNPKKTYFHLVFCL